ncbi:hypothetical protein BH10BDE1_BH10BDE1_08020 [soil metagenome]
MSKHKLLACSIAPLAKVDRRDVVTWCEISKLIGSNSLFVDRTEIVESPFRIAIDSRCRLPSMPSRFSKNYEQICDERAAELLMLQSQLEKPLCLLYSGGIDSTLMLVSFMKRLSESELRDRIVVYLNSNSINENPEFYRSFVRPRFRFESSEKALDQLDGHNIVVGAEFNDHLFGNYILQMLALYYGPAIYRAKYDVDRVREILGAVGMSDEGRDFWTTTLDHVFKTQTAARGETMMDFFWWFNFNNRWQASYFSMILRMPERYRKSVNSDFLISNYHHFFMTDDFQCWSIANPDKKIKDSWESYKWPAKDLIYEFNGDQKYRDTKIKAPSLNYILMQKKTASGLTDDFEFHDHLHAHHYLKP